jgi:peptide/nickel transport system substrate-binding protein
MALTRDRQTSRTLYRSALILLLIACSEESDRATFPASNRTLVIAASADADVLFPPLINSIPSRQIAEQIYDYLAVVGPGLNTFGDNGFFPRLADSWKWSADSLSITFTINPRARWHDGVAADATDVQYTYRVYTNAKLASPTASELSNIDSVSVSDSRNATFWYHTRSSHQLLDATQMMILPRHLFERIPMDSLEAAGRAATPIGTGRFRFKKRTFTSSLELSADTGNYRGRPGLDRVIWSVAPNPGTAAMQLLGGEADFYAALKPEDVAETKRHPELRVISIPGTYYFFVAFNLRKQIFASRDLRRALTMGVDRQSLVKNVFDTLAKIAIGPTARVFPTTDTTLRQIPFDPKRANAILDSLGWRTKSADSVRMRNGKRLSFTALVPSSSVPRVRIAVLMQEQLRRIGADMQIEKMEFNTFRSRVESRDFEAAFDNLQLGATPNSLPEAWGSRSAREKGGMNHSSYQNRQFDAYADSAIMARTIPSSRHFFAMAYQTIIDDAPAIWIYEPKTVIGLNRRIKTGVMRADAWWFDLGSWSIRQSEQIARDRVRAGH